LNDWLKSTEFSDVRDTLLHNLQASDRIRLIVQTQDWQVQQLPWQRWELGDRYPQLEIALASAAHDAPPQRSKRRQCVKILAILGDSSGINVQADQAFLQGLPHAEVTFLPQPSLKDVGDRLWEQPWDILFFAGHSTSHGAAGKGKLFINPEQFFTIDDLKHSLRQAVQRGLKLAIFNSCDGLGLARDLAELQIPQTIAMREPVPDRVAQEFLKYFLTAYLEGAPLYTAVRTARLRLETLENQFPCATWLPVIYQHPEAQPPTWQELAGDPVHRPNPVLAVGASAAIATLVLGVRFLGLLQPLELSSFDGLLRTRATWFPENPDPRVLVVEIDESDVAFQREKQEKLEDFSISDAALSQLIQRLNRYQPAAIGLDLILNAKSASPAITQQFQQTPNLIGGCMVPAEAYPQGISPPAGIPVERQGFVDFVPDPDGVVRRQLLFLTPPETAACGATFSLSVRLAQRYLATQNISLSFTPDDYLQLGQTVFYPLRGQSASGGYQHPRQRLQLGADDFSSQILLNYRAKAVPSLSLSQVLKGEIDGSKLKNQVILVGVTRRDGSHGTKDLLPTPYDRTTLTPGVFIHAQMTSQLISAALNEPGRAPLRVWLWWQDGLWIGAWAMAAGLLMWWFQRTISRVVNLSVVIGIILLLGTVLFIGQGVWVALAPALLASVLAAIASILAQQIPWVQPKRQKNQGFQSKRSLI
jgi:CHASE2 domain-containing sensor protein